MGVSHTEIVREYIMALNMDLPHLKPENKLFYRGNPSSNKSPSKFVDQVIGEKYLKSVPREISEFLGLENPKKYKSHSIRHSAACIAAQNGATAPQLMVSLTFCKILQSDNICLISKLWFLYSEHY